MKNLLLIFTLFIGVINAAFSQITLTINDIATAGDQVISSNVPYAGEVPALGAGQSYDLSSLLPGAFEDTINYIPAAGTPFASQMPGANICQAGPGSYTYFVRNNNGFFLKGFVFSIPSDSSFIQLPSDFVFTMSPQIPIMTFPAGMGMNLNTQSTSSRIEIPYDTTIEINGVQTQITKIGIKLNIKDTSKIDGWGTATFPGGQYDVLRNYHAMDLSTTLEAYIILFGNIGTWVPLPANLIPGGAGDLLGGNTRDVMLWTNGRKQPLVTMSLDTLGLVTNADVQSDLLIVSNRSIVSELQSFEFYPNPVSSILTMNLPDDSQRIRILDVAGRTVREFGNFGRRAELSVSGLKDGVYVIESASDSGEISHKRLVIRH